MITIAQIKAECREAIELGQSASDGPWRTHKERPWEVIEPCKGGVHQIANLSPRDFSTLGMTTSCNNARQIAHARTFSPAAARALLGMVDLLEDMATGDGLMGSIARIKLDEIRGQWEGQS